jgi:hypothetical protein
VFRPSALFLAVTLLEAVFLMFSLSAVSVALGIKAAEFGGVFGFSRVIKPKWGLLSFILCVFIGLSIVAPIVPYVLSVLAVPYLPSPLLPEYYVYAGLFLSGLVAIAVTHIFRWVAVNNAEQMLAQAESI